jgi:UrcA family protein
MNTQITYRKSASLVAITLLALGYSGFCAAAGAGTGPHVSVSVSYADLNLSSTQGAATLYQRLESAASTVCQKMHRYDVSIFASLRIAECAQHKVREAVKKLGAPMLVAVYNAHSSKPLPSRTILAQAR